MTLEIPGPAPTVVTPLQIRMDSDGHQATWSATSQLAGKYQVSVNGSAAFDGYSEFEVEIAPIGSIGMTVRDVRFKFPLGKSACRYMMKGGGTGVPIGNASSFELGWKIHERGLIKNAVFVFDKS